ncbi:Bug family tripartite tricarboxylate transporter substrate binding protein [Azohydromonas aeria]|uniref:Bug family tripartite tricarboxylate transporter substrate binding protein n=1 Tax=Azohydromonas aeria TaxID=2590212 RepID=UPI0012F9156C|nr:tripartite tricarboxylate transporter substrate binding protein [Azohydromonas aeria]
MTFPRRSLLVLALAAAACGGAQAQAWPAKPITWVVPFAPGGSTDVVARVVAQGLQTALKQTVVVDNRAGAGGVIGVTAVAKAPADGYTLIGGTISTHAINATLYKSLPYDPVKDFEPVSLIAFVPNALMVNPALGVNSVQELLAWIKAHPKEASYASSGAGTSTHLTGALLADTLGVPMMHVPYKGSPQALQDVVAGNVPFLFDQLTAGLPLAKGGKLKVLAVTSQKRNVLAPDVPTMAEAGMPGFNLVSWQAVYAPKGTPRDVVQRLSAEISRVLQQPEVKSKLEQQFGMEVVGGGPEQLAALMRTDIPRLGALVKKTGASAE